MAEDGGVVVEIELDASTEVEDDVAFCTPGARELLVEFPFCLDPSFNHHRLCR